LAGADVLADLGDDHADDSSAGARRIVFSSRRSRHLRAQTRGLHLRVGDGALFAGRPGFGAAWLASASATSARALAVSCWAWSSAC